MKNCIRIQLNKLAEKKLLITEKFHRILKKNVLIFSIYKEKFLDNFLLKCITLAFTNYFIFKRLFYGQQLYQEITKKPET